MISRFINPYITNGKKEYELIVLNGEDIIHRQLCKFKDTATDEEMETFATKVIANLDLKQMVEKAIIDKPIKN